MTGTMRHSLVQRAKYFQEMQFSVCVLPHLFCISTHILPIILLTLYILTLCIHLIVPIHLDDKDFETKATTPLSTPTPAQKLVQCSGSGLIKDFK